MASGLQTNLRNILQEYNSCLNYTNAIINHLPLADDYIQLEYVENTSTAYTVMHFTSTNYLGFEIDMEVYPGTGANVFGGYIYNTTNTNNFMYLGTRNNTISYFPTPREHAISATPYNSRHTWKWLVNNGVCSYYFDNNLVGESTQLTNAGCTIGLFTFVDPDGISRSNEDEVFRGKIYSFKVYDGDILQHNIIPIQRIQNGEYTEKCLYDTITGDYYYNINTSTSFNFGGVI